MTHEPRSARRTGSLIALVGPLVDLCVDEGAITAAQQVDPIKAAELEAAPCNFRALQHDVL